MTVTDQPTQPAAPSESTFLYHPPFGTSVIQKIIPHRYPFLLIDGVTGLGEDWVTGFKNLAANECVFQGHFPGEPIYPGVMMIETIAQAGACWILSRREHIGKIAYLMTVETAKFRSPAVPGDRLEMSGKITHLKSRTGRLEGELRVGNRVVCQAALTFAFQRGLNTGSGNADGNH